MGALRPRGPLPWTAEHRILMGPHSHPEAVMTARPLALVAAALLVNACAPAAPGDTYRVAVLRYQAETCTFCPGEDTEVEDWTRLRPLLTGDEVLESGGYTSGFTHQARAFGDMELVGITSPWNVFGSSSRTWNSEASFEEFMGTMIEELEAGGPWDGVYLALHGSMGVRNIPRPEAEIARRVREVVGEGVPIVGTFDLHGNEDGEFLRWADGAFVTKRFPHYDAYLQGERAARYMREIMRGAYTPTTASRKPPVLTATVLQWTGAAPASEIMERARRWEARERGAFVSVFFGYPWTDVPDVGVGIHVMTNDDQALADEIADDMDEFVWRVREEFANGDFPMPDEAVLAARQAIAEGRVPVAMGDYSDRPGDATWILHQILEQGVDNVLYSGLRDENVLADLQESGAAPGDAFDMEVGGFTGESAGIPVRIQGTIRYVGEWQRYDYVAVVDFGGSSTLIISPAYEQTIYPETMRVGGIEPDDYDVFIVKSRAHFRRGFDETGYAQTILVVDAPGPWVGTTRLDALDYEFAPIDRMYPFGETGR